MSGITYNVETVFSAKGDLVPKTEAMASGLGKVSHAAHSANLNISKLGFGLQHVSSTLMAPFDAIANSILGIGSSLLKLGAAAAVGGLSYGIVGVNASLEKTQISLATLMNMSGMSSGFEEGMVRSSAVMERMRADAAKLPGEFKDLSQIMQAIMVPGGRSGLSINSVEKLATKTMILGATMEGMDMATAGREMAMLMEGRSGGHNVLGRKLAGLSGDAATKFNQKSYEERLKFLMPFLDKATESTYAFSKSWEGLTSTFIDNGKQILKTITKPLFDKLKLSFEEINTFYDKHKDKIMFISSMIGRKIGMAFDFAKEKMIEWYPIIEKFAVNAYDRISSIWRKIEPIVESIGKKISNFLQDPAAIDKLIHLAELYGGAKLAGKAADTGLSLLFAGSTISRALGGNGALFGSAQQPATKSGSVPPIVPMGIFAEFSSVFGAAGIATALAATTLAAISAAGAVHVLTDENNMFHAESTKVLDITRQNLNELGATISKGATFSQMVTDPIMRFMTDMMDAAGMMALVSFGELTSSIVNLKKTLFGAKVTDDGEMLDVQKDYSKADYSKIASVNEALGYGSVVGSVGERTTYRVPLAGGPLSALQIKELQDRSILSNQEEIRRGFKKGDELNDKKNKADTQNKPPSGGTNIQKVEIVVTSNQDPSRIARHVMLEIQNVSRNRRAAPRGY